MLPTAEREKYDTFIAANPAAVFFSSWYLDAVCGQNNWGCVFANDKDGELAAVWPYFRKKRLWGLINTLDKPPYCLFFGPRVSQPKTAMNPAKALSRYHRLMQVLEAKLPKAFLRRAYLPYGQFNILPLRQRAWQGQLFHSYRLPTHQQSVDVIQQRFAPKLRHDLKKYPDFREQGRIKVLEDPNEMLILDSNFSDYRSSRASSKTGQHNSSSVLPQLINTATKQHASIGWLFQQSTGQVSAGVWLVYDAASCYLLVAASDPNLRSEDKAISQLIWHAIQWATERKLIFDFEGSSLPGVEAFYRSWGPEIATYCRVEKRAF